MPTLSIVIPAKNEEENLPRLLASLKAQTLQPTEVIVADAGSTDRTREIAKEFGARVVEGGLPGAGRNKGAKAATSEFIFFFDADVELKDARYLERVMEAVEQNGLDLATTDVLPIEDHKADVLLHKAYNKYVRLWGKWYAHAPGFCILVRKSLHEEINGFDETILYAEDYDYTRRAGRIGTFGIVNGTHLCVSTRRQKKDGRVWMACRCILAELHLLTIGPIRHNKFRYSFEHDKEK